MRIVLNASYWELDKKTEKLIPYELICTQAGLSPISNPTVLFVMPDNSQGRLYPNTAVYPMNGMIINATNTTNA